MVDENESLYILLALDIIMPDISTFKHFILSSLDINMVGEGVKRVSQYYRSSQHFLV